MRAVQICSWIFTGSHSLHWPWTCPKNYILQGWNTPHISAATELKASHISGRWKRPSHVASCPYMNTIFGLICLGRQWDKDHGFRSFLLVYECCERKWCVGELGYVGNSSGTSWADKHGRKSSTKCDSETDVVLQAPSHNRKETFSDTKLGSDSKVQSASNPSSFCEIYSQLSAW